LKERKMVTAKRQLEITRQTHCLTIIRLGQQEAWMQCELCGATVPHLRVAGVAAALSISETAVFRLAEAGDIHSIETPDGRLMVCGSSVAAIGRELERPKGERK
jgi:hypothetical protein